MIVLSPRATCVIPTHRRPALLREALGSALAQVLPPLEILVIDDVDDHETREVVEAVARRSCVPIHYVRHGEGRGPSTSRNLGARLACGDWLAFLDDDDRWLPRYLAVAVARESADLVLTARWDFDGAGHRRPGKSPLPEYDARTWLRRNPGGTGSSTVIRRDTFLRIGGYDPKLRSGEDRDLVIRAMRAGARYAAVGERLVEHREDGPRLTRDARTLWSGRLRFVAKHCREMGIADVGHVLRKTWREVRRRDPREPRAPGRRRA